MPKIKEKHSSMFNIAFMCHARINPDDYFSSLVDPDKLSLSNIVLYNDGTEEFIILKGTI